MKANEAPEKLYFDVNNNLIGLYDSAILGMFSAKNTETSIEYTRSDAFIKKAVSYLNSKLYDWVQTTNPNQRSYANTIMKQDFIDDFRNYMKGE